MGKEAGYFITVEGTEGSGKSGVLEFIINNLRTRGFSVDEFHDPGSTEIGQRIRQMALFSKEDGLGDLTRKTNLFLFGAARAALVETYIRPNMRMGHIVFVDRFSDSSRAIQGYAEGIRMEDVRIVDTYATQGLEPNLTILLDVPARIGLQRKRAQGEWNDWEARGVKFHERVRKGFLYLAKKYPDRMVKINARQQKVKVNADVLEVINQRLSAAGYI